MNWNNIKVVSNSYNQLPKFKFLIYFSQDKNNIYCETILISAINEIDAIEIVKSLKPGKSIGKIKQVNY